MLSALKRIWKAATLAVRTRWQILKLFIAHAIRRKRLRDISLTRIEGIVQQNGINVVAVHASGCHRISIQGQSILPGDINILRIWLTHPRKSITVQFHGVFETQVTTMVLAGDRIEIHKPESPRLTLPLIEQTTLSQAQISTLKPIKALRHTPHVELPSVHLAWPSFTIPRQSQPPH